MPAPEPNPLVDLNNARNLPPPSKFRGLFKPAPSDTIFDQAIALAEANPDQDRIQLGNRLFEIRRGPPPELTITIYEIES